MESNVVFAGAARTLEEHEFARLNCQSHRVERLHRMAASAAYLTHIAKS